MSSSNPLLQNTTNPLFAQLKVEHMQPAMQQILQESDAKIASLLQLDDKNWHNFIAPVENILDKVHAAFSPISHLNAVKSSEELRAVYEPLQQQVSEFYTLLAQNSDLYQAYEKVLQQYKSELEPNQLKVLTDALRDFNLAGVALAPQDKQRFVELSKELADLGSKFSNNVMDCTDKWSLNITDKAQLAGLPDYIVSAAASAAKAAQQTGFTFDLHIPTYMAVMQYAQNRKLREQFYNAYVTRASKLGDHDAKFDNSELMFKILANRLEQANLLGFEDYSERALVLRMASSSPEVHGFLHEMLTKASNQAHAEMEQLKKLALERDNITDFAPWDVAYYSELLKLQEFDLNSETLRPYFPLEKVLSGMFAIVQKLYGISIQEEQNNEVWHPAVRFFKVYDKQQRLQGEFYIDLFARANKRGGAWMDECRCRSILSGELQLPVAYLVCNFTPPSADHPTLLTHEEVTTLFHEFGHTLHHILTTIDYPSISGINGVPWDGVELPSQFFENFAWQNETLPLISEHYQTKEPLPAELLAKLKKSRQFLQGIALIRQIEFAHFDISLHDIFSPAGGVEQIQATLDKVREQTALLSVTANNAFQNSFSHIFAGGYAAGYYSYLWAEVLAQDAFAKFTEQGILNSKVGAEFLTTILQQGGSQDFMQLFREFREREPSIDAFLADRGIYA